MRFIQIKFASNTKSRNIFCRDALKLLFTRCLICYHPRAADAWQTHLNTRRASSVSRAADCLTVSDGGAQGRDRRNSNLSKTSIDSGVELIDLNNKVDYNSMQEFNPKQLKSHCTYENHGFTFEDEDDSENEQITRPSFHVQPPNIMDEEIRPAMCGTNEQRPINILRYNNVRVVLFHPDVTVCQTPDQDGEDMPVFEELTSDKSSSLQ